VENAKKINNKPPLPLNRRKLYSLKALWSSRNKKKSMQRMQRSSVSSQHSI